MCIFIKVSCPLMEHGLFLPSRPDGWGWARGVGGWGQSELSLRGLCGKRGTAPGDLVDDGGRLKR